MGTITIPPPVKLIAGLLAGSNQHLERGRRKLAEAFGPLEDKSPVIPDRKSVV